MLPDRFFEEPIASGPRQGDVLDRRGFEESIATYYRLMGWDDSGRPTEATLLDHKLEWVLNKAS
jgi:aldehyde:ferredoxin oxidoreductase